MRRKVNLIPSFTILAQNYMGLLEDPHLPLVPKSEGLLFLKATLVKKKSNEIEMHWLSVTVSIHELFQLSASRNPEENSISILQHQSLTHKIQWSIRIFNLTMTSHYINPKPKNHMCNIKYADKFNMFIQQVFSIGSEMIFAAYPKTISKQNIKKIKLVKILTILSFYLTLLKC